MRVNRFLAVIAALAAGIGLGFAFGLLRPRGSARGDVGWDRAD